VAEHDTPTGDPLVSETEQHAQEAGQARAMQAANLFDLRKIIGGVFALYGVVLVIVGLFDSDAEVAKAAGVRINLWAGLGMLALSAVFLIWAFTRPLSEELDDSAEFGGGPRGDSQGAVGNADAGR
jgi:hypothetical protein